MTLQQVKDKLKKQREKLFIKYQIESLAVFGSVSRGDNQPDSDIDMLVEFKNPIGIEFIDLADELENILDRKVDLVSKGGIKKRYFKHIESDLKYV